MSILDVTDAGRHLRLEVDEAGWADSAEGVAVQSKLDMAEEIVFDYLKDRDNENGWTDEDIPGPVRAGILLTLSDLWEHRAGSADDDVFLSKATKSLLHRYRDPALA